jgi:tetratricopeptide (TPR) repeat protein
MVSVSRDGSVPSPVAPAIPWAGLFVVLLVTALAYGPSFGNGVTNWDDDAYVLGNPWIGQHSWAAVVSMFQTTFKANYHPLTMLSLWLDGAIGGGNVVVHHVVNGALHLANTALAAIFTLRLTRRRGLALVVALLFGLHPIHVESVAWISERKDVLYAFFYLASLLAYLRCVRSVADRRSSPVAWYIVSLLLFVASLLSKGTAVTLAPTLLLVDILLERRVFSFRVLLEKLPFFAIALVSGLVTLLAQSEVGQLVGESDWTGLERVALSSAAYCRYLLLLIAPLGLSAFHPYPERIEGALPVVYWLAPLGFLIVQGATIGLHRRAPLVAFGLAFFTLNVLLMLQWIPVGGALIAERYAYVPSLGFFIAVAATGAAGLARWPSLRTPLLALLIVCSLGLGVATWQRSHVWHDSLRLWDDTLARHPDVPVARLNRALARHETGDLAGALADLDATIARDPDYAKALGHRGVMRFQAGDVEAGLRDLDRALILEPSTDAYLNRGAIRLMDGDTIGALADFDRVVEADPYQPLAWSNRGLAQNAAGRYASAISDFDNALALSPDYTPALLGRVEARLGLGPPQRALAEADALLAVYPDWVEVSWVRGRALLELDQREAACAEFAKAAAAGFVEAAEKSASECAP